MVAQQGDFLPRITRRISYITTLAREVQYGVMSFLLLTTNNDSFNALRQVVIILSGLNGVYDFYMKGTNTGVRDYSLNTIGFRPQHIW